MPTMLSVLLSFCRRRKLLRLSPMVKSGSVLSVGVLRTLAKQKQLQASM